MKKQLLWKLFLIMVTGIVALFWAIGLATSHTEEGMSFIDIEHREQMKVWAEEVEQIYHSGDKQALTEWLENIRDTEQTWVSLAKDNIEHIAGEPLLDGYNHGNTLGRSVDWKIHLYFEENPVMEVPFAQGQISFLIQLPDRMRPGSYVDYTLFFLKIILPMILLALLAFVLYQHIMNPLQQLKRATRSFSQGNFDVRVRQLLGNRNDELSDLADTFDQMATRIGEQIITQRQLISDLSHELRTPLTRLDISIQSLQESQDTQVHIDRIERESKCIRKLVDDSLTLAWLENERPELQQESLDLTDLLDVLIDDGKFEFNDRNLATDLPSSAEIHRSNHRSLGQALENIIRNALRYTPAEQTVSVSMTEQDKHYQISICDQGPGVPEQYLEAIFQPFFRVDSSRQSSSKGFGLGLALARRQIMAVGGFVHASNIANGGLAMNITLPKN